MAITKQYWTAQNILDRVKDELDLTEETFVDDEELIRYCNAAIDRAEQKIIGIHKDYFLSSESLLTLTYSNLDIGPVEITGLDPNDVVLFGGPWPSDVLAGDEISLQSESYDTWYTILSVSGDTLVIDGDPSVGAGQGFQIRHRGLTSGQRRYTLPPNIYAHKIRRVVYANGSRVYKITRLQDWKKFEIKAISDINSGSGCYEYFLTNDTPGQPEMLFVPSPSETGDSVTVWYIRQANRFVFPVADPNNILDIPEAFNYVVEFVKMKCDIKEKRLHGQVQSGDYPEVLLEMNEMIGVLQEIVPDAENLIEPDFSAYEEHS